MLLDNALATMGAGLPSAMAARLVEPDKQVMAICGDGGFMMNSQELETAVRLGMNLVVLILRDDGYGMIKWKQADMGFADWGLDYGNPDFVQYAASYGAYGHDDLLPTMRECLAAPGVHLIEVPVELRSQSGPPRKGAGLPIASSAWLFASDTQARQLRSVDRPTPRHIRARIRSRDWWPQAALVGSGMPYAVLLGVWHRSGMQQGPSWRRRLGAIMATYR